MKVVKEDYYQTNINRGIIVDKIDEDLLREYLWHYYHHASVGNEGIRNNINEFKTLNRAIAFRMNLNMDRTRFIIYIDQDVFNNRRDNIISIDRSLYQILFIKRVDCKMDRPYKGIYRVCGSYYVETYYKGVKHRLGRFSDLNEAKKVYYEAVKSFYPELDELMKLFNIKELL